MRKILFIGLVVTAVVLVSGCYGPTTSPNATVQPTGETPAEITPVMTPVETVIPIETATPVVITTVTGTSYATPVTTATLMTTPVSTVAGTATPFPTVVTANTVKITSSGYDPAIISVPIGTRVTWTNTDTVSHTVTSNTGGFDSGSLGSGSTFSWTFSTSGSYDYGDSNNASMGGGTVVVTS